MRSLGVPYCAPASPFLNIVIRGISAALLAVLPGAHRHERAVKGSAVPSAPSLPAEGPGPAQTIEARIPPKS